MSVRPPRWHCAQMAKQPCWLGLAKQPCWGFGIARRWRSNLVGLGLAKQPCWGFVDLICCEGTALQPAHTWSRTTLLGIWPARDQPCWYLVVTPYSEATLFKHWWIGDLMIRHGSRIHECS